MKGEKCQKSWICPAKNIFKIVGSQGCLFIHQSVIIIELLQRSANYKCQGLSRAEMMRHSHRLKSGPVFQMLVLPTQPLGGSVIFSFSKSSWMDWATTATASLMWADSFFPLMSWRPIRPETRPTKNKRQSLIWAGYSLSGSFCNAQSG